jgi:hypothetical protein
MAFLDHVIDGTTIRFKRSSVSGESPTTAMLRPGEIAVNTADGLVFIGSADGVKSLGESNQIVSSGAISALTSIQQSRIKVGTIVTTTDGRRWVYSGSGSKVLEASYVELADITPAWAAIPDKPSTFTPSSHTHAISDVTNLQTSLDAKVSSVTTGIAGADQITNMVSLTQAEYTALATKNASTFYVIVG